MNLETCKQIFANHKLPAISNIKKVDVGFTNKVYDIDDRYILKVCVSDNNETNFRREVKLYSFFKDMLPVPEILVFDESKSIYPKMYMIYPKIRGDNLYDVWHTLSDTQRKKIVKQLCGYLKIINQVNIQDLPNDLGLEEIKNWKDHILTKVSQHLSTLEKNRILSKKEVASVRNFVETNSFALEEQKIALVYWDAHFDNILVKDSAIVGLLDFERTELGSIDFVLDIVKRMVNEPTKYMSAHAEQFAKDEDYAKLMDWYKEFYPELFAFKHLGLRLDLYMIEHDASTLIDWPKAGSLKKGILRVASK